MEVLTVDTTHHPSGRADVAVLGCGLMGSALVRTLAGAGHKVVAWNRTHERAAALQGDRVTPKQSLNDAVAAAPVVIACLSTYDSVRSTLDGIDLADTALVNLTSGSPQGAHELAAWANERSLAYLEGAIVAFPDFIGHADAILAYSGPKQVWDDHGDLLTCLGGQSSWLNERIDAANVFDGALIASFYTTAISAYVESATYALDHGVPRHLLRAATRLVLRTLGHSTKEAAAAIESGDYATEQARLSTYADGTANLLQSMRQAGLPARFLTATVDSLETACDEGLGELGIYAQAEVTRAKPLGS